MADIIQTITTRFPVLGQEDLDKAEASLKRLNNTTDLTGTKKQFADLGSILDNISSTQISKLKRGFNDMGTALNPLANALKNLPTDKVKQLNEYLGDTADEFKVVAKQVEFLRANIDKLDLKPEEFAELSESLDIADGICKEFAETIDQTANSNKRLSTVLRDMRNELTKLEQAGKEGTQEFINLQVAAAKLENQLTTNSRAVTALASDTANIDAGIGAIRGITAAFAIYQGVLSATGEENEDLKEALLKLTAAMAILQGLEEIQKLTKSDNIVILKLQSLWNGIYTTSLQGATLATTEATAATTLFGVSIRTLLASTGIGLLIAGLATLVGIFSSYASEAQEAAEAQDNLNASTKKYKNEIAEQIIQDKEYQKILSAGSEQTEREIELLAKKGASLDALGTKQLELANRDIRDTEKRIFLLKDLNDASLRPKILDEENELREKIAQRDKLQVEINQKELIAAHKIHELRISNIKDEYTKAIESIEAQGREEIRLNKLSNEFTGRQKEQFEREVNSRIRAEKLRLDLAANQQLAIAFNELTQDVYDKQIKAKEIQNQIELAAFVGNADARFLKEQTLEEELSILKVKLDEDAALKIQAIQDSLIKDEYTKRVKSFEAQAKAEIKAFVGSKEDRDKFEIEIAKRTQAEIERLNKEANDRILDLKTSLIADEYTKQVQAAQDAYLKDYEAFVGNEKDKEAYKLLLEQQRNKKIKKLTDDAESKIKDVRISNIENIYKREREAAEKKYKEDVENFIGSSEQKERYIKERLKQFENEIGGTSFLSKLFSLNKEEEAAANKALGAAIALLDQYYNAKIAKDDAEVAAQEEKVRRLTELAEYGSQELLQLEEERLEASKRRRAEDLQDQQQIAALMIAANNAVSISEGIKAVIAAFGTPGGLFTGIATGIAVAATLASTILTLNNAFGSIPGFAEGTDYFNGKGTAKSDSNLALLSVGERVVDNETNAKLKGVKNKDLPKYVSMGMLVENTLVNRDLYSQVARSIPDIQIPQQPAKDYTEQFTQLVKEQKKMARALEKFQVAFNVTEDGIEGSVTKVKEHKERISKIANL